MAFSPAVWGWLFSQEEAREEVKRKLLLPSTVHFFFLSSSPWLRLPQSFLFPSLVQWQLLFLLESALGTAFISDAAQKHFSVWNICRCFKRRGRFFWSWTCRCFWVPFILILWFLSLLHWMFFIIFLNKRVKKIWPKCLQEFRVIFLLRDQFQILKIKKSCLLHLEMLSLGKLE